MSVAGGIILFFWALIAGYVIGYSVHEREYKEILNEYWEEQNGSGND